MTRKSCFAEELDPRMRANYTIRVRDIDPGALRIVEVFWWEESELTYVSYERRDGERHVATVDWRHE